MAAIIEFPVGFHNELQNSRPVHRDAVVAARGLCTVRPSARVYRRRRLAVGMIAAVVVALGVLAVTSTALALAVSAPADPVASGHYHVVGPGETMWSIAGDVAPDADRTEVIDDLVALNGRMSLEVGEVVALPILRP